jgi:hypothetical protein
MRSFSRSLLRICIAVGIILLLGFVFYRFGRSLWNPIVVKIVGGKSIDDRLREIEIRHPDLKGAVFGQIVIIAYKDPGVLNIYNNGTLWDTFAMTAKSGKPGPKLRDGDRQIPEGIYSICALNPNSSYYLSLKISYPNREDQSRSHALGIHDLGGDIYIHGKDVSIGCLAIGDDAIEKVFYAVARSSQGPAQVLIAPNKAVHGEEQYEPFYTKLRQEILNVVGK